MQRALIKTWTGLDWNGPDRTGSTLEVVTWSHLHAYICRDTVLQLHTVLDGGSDHLPSFR